VNVLARKMKTIKKV